MCSPGLSGSLKEGQPPRVPQSRQSVGSTPWHARFRPACRMRSPLQYRHKPRHRQAGTPGRDPALRVYCHRETGYREDGARREYNPFLSPTGKAPWHHHVLGNITGVTATDKEDMPVFLSVSLCLRTFVISLFTSLSHQEIPRIEIPVPFRNGYCRPVDFVFR